MPSLAFIDTNVLIDIEHSKSSVSIQNQLISVVTATEFLQTQHHKTGKANYCIPTMGKSQLPHETEYSAYAPTRRDHAFGPQSTDKQILPEPIGSVTKTILGNRALTKIINQKLLHVFRLATSHLANDRQKELLRCFHLLIENDVKCVIMTDEIAATAVEFVPILLSKGQTKQNLRNEYNDLLILATAKTLRTNLIISSGDNKLREIADGIKAKQEVTHLSTTIKFEQDEPQAPVKNNKESKGYINRRLQQALHQSFCDY